MHVAWSDRKTNEKACVRILPLALTLATLLPSAPCSSPHIYIYTAEAFARRGSPESLLGAAVERAGGRPVSSARTLAASDPLGNLISLTS